MPEKNTKVMEVYCNCDNCRMPMGNSRHVAVRVLLGLLILFVMFYIGFKLGEFKGMFMSDNYGSFGPRHNMMYFKDDGTFNKLIVPTTNTQTTTGSSAAGSTSTK